MARLLPQPPEPAADVSSTDRGDLHAALNALDVMVFPRCELPTSRGALRLAAGCALLGDELPVALDHLEHPAVEILGGLGRSTRHSGRAGASSDSAILRRPQLAGKLPPWNSRASTAKRFTPSSGPRRREVRCVAAPSLHGGRGRSSGRLRSARRGWPTTRGT